MIQVNKNLNRYSEALVGFRRDLHRIPEIGYNEHKTQKYLLDKLSILQNFKVEKCAGTGIKAVCMLDDKYKTIGFRADMDGLEIQEANDVAYKSCHDGFMHACGHDGHMAMVLALACYINDNIDRLKYNVVLLFQPAEESYGGAKSMIDADALSNPKIDVMYGYHLMPSLPIGKIGYRCGAMMAQASEFDVRFIGKSAHGAMPDQGADALAAACQFVTASQGIVSRCIDPYEQCVITYGSILGGALRNIICDDCVIKGTMRTFSTKNYNLAKSRLINIAEASAHMYGCKAEYIEKVVYPFVNNPVKETIDALDILGDSAQEVAPMMIAEDFSFYQRKVPAVFMFLGCLDTVKPRKLHSEEFNFDEGVLAFGLDIYIKLLGIH